MPRQFSLEFITFSGADASGDGLDERKFPRCDLSIQRLPFLGTVHGRLALAEDTRSPEGSVRQREPDLVRMSWIGDLGNGASMDRSQRQIPGQLAGRVVRKEAFGDCAFSGSIASIVSEP